MAQIQRPSRVRRKQEAAHARPERKRESTVNGGLSWIAQKALESAASELGKLLIGWIWRGGLSVAAAWLLERLFG